MGSKGTTIIIKNRKNIFLYCPICNNAKTLFQISRHKYSRKVWFCKNCDKIRINWKLYGSEVRNDS